MRILRRRTLRTDIHSFFLTLLHIGQKSYESGGGGGGGDMGNSNIKVTGVLVDFCFVGVAPNFYHPLLYSNYDSNEQFLFPLCKQDH